MGARSLLLGSRDTIRVMTRVIMRDSIRTTMRASRRVTKRATIRDNYYNQSFGGLGL